MGKSCGNDRCAVAVGHTASRHQQDHKDIVDAELAATRVLDVDGVVFHLGRHAKCMNARARTGGEGEVSGPYRDAERTDENMAAGWLISILHRRRASAEIHPRSQEVLATLTMSKLAEFDRCLSIKDLGDSLNLGSRLTFSNVEA